MKDNIDSFSNMHASYQTKHTFSIYKLYLELFAIIVIIVSFFIFCHRHRHNKLYKN